MNITLIEGLIIVVAGALVFTVIVNVVQTKPILNTHIECRDLNDAVVFKSKDSAYIINDIVKSEDETYIIPAGTVCRKIKDKQ